MQSCFRSMWQLKKELLMMEGWVLGLNWEIGILILYIHFEVNSKIYVLIRVGETNFNIFYIFYGAKHLVTFKFNATWMWQFFLGCLFWRNTCFRCTSRNERWSAHFEIWESAITTGSNLNDQHPPNASKNTHCYLQQREINLNEKCFDLHLNSATIYLTCK